MGKIGSEKAIESLEESLEKALFDFDEYACSRAVEALGKIGSEKAIESLETALFDSDAYLRYQAAEALGKIGSEKAIESLERTLFESDDYFRTNAAEALGNIGSEKAIESLKMVLNDSHKSVRGNAVEALGNIGSDKAVETLVKALNDSDENVRRNAAEALGNIGSNKAINGLSTLLLNGDCQYYSRSFANILRALETIQDKCQIYQQRIKLMTNSEIFISYAWGGESETLTNELDNAFEAKGITIIRDKRDLGYKGLIKEFMQRIGQGKCIIVVLSDKYLKSENCMFELIEIFKNDNFTDRIFPININANIYKATDRLKYRRYWEDELNELQEAIKQGDITNLAGIYDDLNLYEEIKRNLPNLTNILKNINVLTPTMHKESDFEEIITAVETRLNED